MLTIQFIPFDDLLNMSSDERTRKLLKIVKENKVIVMQGHLSPEEETALIQKTMENISKTFKGVELCTIYPKKKKDEELFKQIRNRFISRLLGNSQGITIIGPATKAVTTRSRKDVFRNEELYLPRLTIKKATIKSLNFSKL